MKFVTAVTCMDGRIQEHVNKYLKDRFNVPYVDTITEPGPNRILADNTNVSVIENIEKRIGISVKHHGSKWIVLVGHEDCAGNPVSKTEQITHIEKGLEVIRAMDFDARLIGIWVDLDGTIEVL